MYGVYASFRDAGSRMMKLHSVIACFAAASMSKRKKRRLPSVESRPRAGEKEQKKKCKANVESRPPPWVGELTQLELIAEWMEGVGRRLSKKAQRTKPRTRAGRSRPRPLISGYVVEIDVAPAASDSEEEAEFGVNRLFPLKRGCYLSELHDSAQTRLLL